MEMDKTSKLKQEIEEYLTKDYCCEFKKECKDGVRIRCSEYEAKLYLILRFAEPREKRIAELEESLKKLQKSTFNMIDKKNNRIAELEKACEETQELLDKQIEATYRLDKENAELKAFRQDCVKLTEDNVVIVRQRAETSKQLSKAKEHIKKLLDCLKQDTNDPQTNYYVCQYMDEAEQFISEV